MKRLLLAAGLMLLLTACDPFEAERTRAQAALVSAQAEGVKAEAARISANADLTNAQSLHAAMDGYILLVDRLLSQINTLTAMLMAQPYLLLAALVLAAPIGALAVALLKKKARPKYIVLVTDQRNATDLLTEVVGYEQAVDIVRRGDLEARAYRRMQ